MTTRALSLYEVNFTPNFTNGSWTSRYPANLFGNYKPINIPDDAQFSRKGWHPKARWNRTDKINFPCDSKNNFSSGGTYSSTPFQQSLDWANPSYGLEANNSSAYYTRPNGVYSEKKSEGFQVSVYDDEDHHTTFIFANLDGLHPTSSKDPNLNKINEHVCNAYTPDVIGYSLKYTGDGSNSADVVGVVNKVGLLYAEKNKLNGSWDTAKQYQNNIFMIIPTKKVPGSYDLGVGAYSDVNISYMLSGEQFQNYEQRFGKEASERKMDKFLFMGFMVEFQHRAKMKATVTMTATIWDFKPIIADEYNANPLSKNRRLLIQPPVDKLRRDVACRWYDDNNVRHPIL